MPQAISERVLALRQKIAQAAERAGRSPYEIRILAATKGRSVAEILAAVAAGIELIGENTVQEALSKFEFLPKSLEKHMIGTLQLNKVKAAVKLFDMIQSVDSLKLAQEIDKAAGKLRKILPVLLEVNPAGEASKRGLSPEEIPALLDQMGSLEFVRVEGLMAMMPYSEHPEELRPHFRLMKQLFDELKRTNGALQWLSMGMSQDFLIAVEEGANLLRLGTVIFGLRSSE